MRKFYALRFVTVLGLMGWMWSATAYGQAVYGSILGTVTDPQGAAVPNVKVTVTNQRKGTADTATSNNDGNYSVTHLIPDTYTVHFEAAGFKHIRISERKRRMLVSN